MTDPVREEMKDLLIKFDEEGCFSPEQENKQIDDLLRVIRGHTIEEKKVVGYAKSLGRGEAYPTVKEIKQKRRVCDMELTHTLESLPKEVKNGKSE